ncbi:CdaR family transcriptional regulator [Paenibacillus sp. 1P07SE]|uniref:CdaR family transcriptional regulator n=1 Tax=Paenibacillus sp. 1P07SE TaxID=3132209 RepID=UPI0039A73DDE
MTGDQQISDALAHTIVQAAKEVIRHEVNFIRTDGVIAASTVPERVGMLHSAALEALATGQVLEVGPESMYTGARPGINYPVVLDGKRLGVIGITGDVEECRPLGYLLTKIAEVMIREQWLSRERQGADEYRHAAVRRLLFGESQGEAELGELLRRYGLSAGEPACVLLLAPHSGAGRTGEELISWIPGLLAAARTPLYAYLFPDRYAILVPQSGYEAMILHLRGLAQHHRFHAGAGSLHGWGELALSYRHAQLALQQAAAGGGPICEFRSMGLEMLLSQLPQEQRRDYARHRIGMLSEAERTTLRTYQAHSMSLKDTAAALFLHKNTLQYRLDKIHRKSGLDPRDYTDSVELYIALLLDGVAPELP